MFHLLSEFQIVLAMLTKPYPILIGPECKNGLLVELRHDKAEVQKYIQILGSANTFFTCYFGMDRLQWGVKVGGEGRSTELDV